LTNCSHKPIWWECCYCNIISFTYEIIWHQLWSGSIRNCFSKN